MSIRLYSLNGKNMQTREQMHDHLKERFELAPYYGRNLDALWDLLTERGEGGAILLLNKERMPEELSCGLLGLLGDLANGSSRWSVNVCSADRAGTEPLVPAPIANVREDRAE